MTVILDSPCYERPLLESSTREDYWKPDGDPSCDTLEVLHGFTLLHGESRGHDA